MLPVSLVVVQMLMTCLGLGLCHSLRQGQMGLNAFSGSLFGLPELLSRVSCVVQVRSLAPCIMIRSEALCVCSSESGGSRLLANLL